MPSPAKPAPRRPHDRYRVAVVDDEPDVHQAIEFILEASEEFECHAHYYSGQAALEGLAQVRPDLVLMDIRMPDLTGIECTRRLMARWPDLPIVMISALDDRETMEAAIRAGCRGYLTKPFGTSQCLAALRCALSGSTSPLGEPGDGRCRWHTQMGDDARLSTRDQAVMKALAGGQLYKEIAESMALSLPMIHKVVHRLFVRFGASNRTEAVNQWQRCRVCQTAAREGGGQEPQSG